MADNSVTLKTITINKENFLKVINPDQVSDVNGILTYNTGIYGTKTDNAFPDLLIDLYSNAAGCHQNLINLKSGLILGNNLQAEDDKKSELLNPFLKKRNKAGDNPKTVYAKACKDMAIANAAVLQVVFTRTGKVAEIYHVPFQDFRLGNPNKYGQIDFGYIGKNWAKIQNSKSSGKNDYVKIKMFDPTQYEKYPVQLMYIKDYSYGYYAVPAYTAAINWILISREISDFHLNNIRTNFFLSGMLTQKKGGMTDEQINANADAIEDLYKGGKGRKILLNYVEDLVNDKPIYDQFQADGQDKIFELLSQQAFQEIVTAHNAYSILAGLDAKGSDLGGDANKLNTSLQAFNYLVCENMKTLLVDGFNRIFEINQLPTVQVITEPLKIAQPIAQPTDLTESERRAMLYGLPPKDNSINNVAPTNSTPA